MRIGSPHDHYESIDDQLHDDFRKLDEEEQMHVFGTVESKGQKKEREIMHIQELRQLGPDTRY